MWITEEVSLVDFHRLGVDLAKLSRYDVLMCFVAREADATGEYEALIEDWQSIDDLTGPKILFLFAADNISQRNKSVTVYHESSQRLKFSADAVLLKSKVMEGTQTNHLHYLRTTPDFELQHLRRHTAANHPHFREKLEYLATRQPSRPELRRIVDAQTSQIRELRSYLGLRESDLPCLHLTFLDGSPSIHHRLHANISFYATLKSMVDVLESAELRDTKGEIDNLSKQLRVVEQGQQRLKGQLNRPRIVSLQSLVATLESRFQSASDQSQVITELVQRLQAHVKIPSQDTRKAVFDSFKPARDILRAMPDWKEIRSNFQHIVDVASQPKSDLPKVNNDLDVLTHTQIGAALDDLEAERQRLVPSLLLKMEKLRALLSAPPSMRLKENMVFTNNVNSFIVVAAQQELDAIREYLDFKGALRAAYDLSENWSAERIKLATDSGAEFGLILAPAQGVADMTELLNFLQKTAAPKNVILVGMMAGIPGRSKLLDVQAPRNIIDGTRLGTREGQIIPEPQGRDVDSILHTRLHALDRARYGIADVPLVTRKYSVCVAAKFDDLSSELAMAALAFDPENVVGIEMEGAALTAKQSGQRRIDESTGYLMIKGVADYAGASASPEELGSLVEVLSAFQGADSSELLLEPHPTNNKQLKSLLQKVATVRALRVALALISESLRIKMATA